MAKVLFAIGWDGFIQVALAIVATLVWAILHFGLEKIKPKDVGQPRQQRPPQPRPAQDPLQAEIDEFLRKAQALREGRPEPPPAAAPARQPQKVAPAGGAARRPRPQRQAAKQEPARQAGRPVPPPVVVEVVDADPTRESVAEHVAHRMGPKFDRAESSMSRMQGESDTEFSKHMERVFSHDVGTLKTAIPGIFTPAAVAAAPAMTAQTSRSGTAPVVVRKAFSDVALFLASRQNLRDAVILNEILQRPVDRW